MTNLRAARSDQQQPGFGLAAAASVRLPGHPASEPDERLGQLLWNVTSLAGMLCDTPIAMVSQLQGQFDCTETGALSLAAAVALDGGMDQRRQWWRLSGQSDIVCSTADFGLCESAALTPERITEISDLTLDQRFAPGGMAKGPTGLRFYAAMPMCNQRGDLLGTLCVLDRKPRLLEQHQRSGLHLLARQFITQVELHRDLQMLQRQTLTDPLTGAGNRRGFDRRLREEWSRHLRSGEVLSLLMIDVDMFKQYNDTYGHPAGDDVLSLLCELLRMPLRASDFVARVGGDEFAVILPNTPEVGAELVVERIQAMLQAAKWPHCPVSISAGVATLSPGEVCDFATLLQRADQAMYMRKHSRRGDD
ncbi:sensor domain-containing diguanylate cyclase [Herbaspirillum lusitanum]|uniref:sensor domain-containing diguanylate cyclase n=1 Tax=Herbaspirillum lusitanum TaxID=213312 RepID=UPI0022373A74|nr:sensor domain-containing diguanylate cyclase [Herbaspirillum lusitanum]MCW5296577.1 sensor domain-containing diguanylate cyclase [Herbaspirillum lusitanum]